MKAINVARDLFNEFIKIYLIFYLENNEIRELNAYLNNNQNNKDNNVVIKLTINLKKRLLKQFRNLETNSIILNSWNNYLRTITNIYGQ